MAAKELGAGGGAKDLNEGGVAMLLHIPSVFWGGGFTKKGGFC